MYLVIMQKYENGGSVLGRVMSFAKLKDMKG